MHLMLYLGQFSFHNSLKWQKVFFYQPQIWAKSKHKQMKNIEAKPSKILVTFSILTVSLVFTGYVNVCYWHLITFSTRHPEIKSALGKHIKIAILDLQKEMKLKWDLFGHCKYLLLIENNMFYLLGPLMSMWMLPPILRGLVQ